MGNPLKSVPSVETKSLAPVPHEAVQVQPSSPSQATTHTAGTKSVLEGPSSGSPQSVVHREPAPQWPTDGLRDPHLSGHEPRYFPGMMARASRQDGLRQGTVSEADDGNPVRNPRNRSAGRDEST